MAAATFSVVFTLLDLFLRLAYAAAGLRAITVDVDADTSIRCLVSSSLLPLGADATTTHRRRRRRPLLLLIHGFGPSPALQWRHQVLGPLAAQFDLVIPDLIFFGGSVTRSGGRSEAFQAAAIAGVMDRVAGLDRRFDVAGTSYGGFVAYLVARAFGRRRVRRVVLASSDLMKTAEDDRELERRAGIGITDLLLPRRPAEVRRVLELAVHRRPRFRLPDFLLRDIIRGFYSENREERTELIKGITIGKDEFQLTHLEQEVLIIWGEHDLIFPVEKAFQIHKVLGEKARLEIMEDTGHLPQSEDPKRFNEILLGFLLRDD